MRFAVVIPARMRSVRLPGKPLADLLGKPLVLHVVERARESGAVTVLVATDDERVRAACAAAGVEAHMTAATHASGTDRVAEIAARLEWDDDAIVVNLQGDEPLMPGSAIRQVAALLDSHAEAGIATLCTPTHSLEEFLNPNVVKLTVDQTGCALYFSRAPIPWNRDGAAGGVGMQTQWQGALRHIGLYAYRVAALRRLAAAPVCLLEQTESLEQLRALWLGMKIAVQAARAAPGPGVDTPDDLQRVANLMKSGLPK